MLPPFLPVTDQETDPVYPESEDLRIREPADGAVLSGYSEREVAWNDLPLEVDIPLSGASTVKIKLYSKGAGQLYWGMGNIKIR